MAKPKPVVWTHAFFRQTPATGWVPEFEEHARQYFDIVTTEDLDKEPEKSSQVTGALLHADHTPYLNTLLPSFANIKAIANFGVGVDHLDIHALSAKGIKVSNTPHILDDAVAELAMTLLLSSARCIVRGNRLAKETALPLDRNDMQAIELTGSTVGIVGMGNIGLCVAKLLKPFNVKLLYHNRSRRSEESEQSVGATYYSCLEEMLPVCDFVIILCPLTPQTKYLMSSRQFHLMKRTATIVNVSRGAVIDTDALVEALQKDRIRAAALDVTDPEPLPASHQLRSLDNVIITPHWGSQTFKTRFAMFDTCVKNLKALFIDSVPMPNEIKL